MLTYKGAVLYNSEFSLTPNLDNFTPISKYGKTPNFFGKKHFTQTIFKVLVRTLCFELFFFTNHIQVFHSFPIPNSLVHLITHVLIKYRRNIIQEECGIYLHSIFPKYLSF